MAIVKGQIESLKRIRTELDRQGITRFNSLGDLKAFTEQFDTEWLNAEANAHALVDQEIDAVRKDARAKQISYQALKAKKSQFLNERIELLTSRHAALKEQGVTLLLLPLKWLRQIRTYYKIRKLKRNFSSIID